MSTVAVVPNESKGYDYDEIPLEACVDAQVRNAWQTIQNILSLGVVDNLEKSEDEQYHEFKTTTAGKILVRWFTFVERYHLSLWHLEVSFYVIFLIIFTVGKSRGSASLLHHSKYSFRASCPPPLLTRRQWPSLRRTPWSPTQPGPLPPSPAPNRPSPPCAPPGRRRPSASRPPAAGSPTCATTSSRACSPSGGTTARPLGSRGGPGCSRSAACAPSARSSSARRRPPRPAPCEQPLVDLRAGRARACV